MQVLGDVISIVKTYEFMPCDLAVKGGRGNRQAEANDPVARPPFRFRGSVLKSGGNSFARTNSGRSGTSSCLCSRHLVDTSSLMKVANVKPHRSLKADYTLRMGLPRNATFLVESK